jgi:hypothetical protein
MNGGGSENAAYNFDSIRAYAGAGVDRVVLAASGAKLQQQADWQRVLGVAFEAWARDFESPGTAGTASTLSQPKSLAALDAAFRQLGEGR